MTTLESRYAERIQEFKAREARIPELRAHVHELEARLEQTSRDMDPDTHFRVVNALEAARKDLAEAADLDAQTQYILDTIPFIKEYTTDLDDDDRAPSVPQTGMDSFVSVAARSNRNTTYRAYLAEVEGQADAVVTRPRGGWGADMVCTACNASCLFNGRESVLLCPECGVVRYFHEGSEHNLSYAEEMALDITTSFSYKRLNHFIEWLNALQAKENTEIPPEIIEALKGEFKKHRTTVRSDIKPTKIREFLKKLGFTKYYEHCHHICALLNGTPPPRLPQELEAKLKKMFADIQEPFEKHCPQTRKNFLSYSYVLYKFCELLGEHEYLQFFPLLKSAEKLHAQDVIWKGICKELSWHFVPSV